MLSIIGPSGSGKSTLLNLVGGLNPRLRRDKIGFTFQFFNLLPTLTWVENVICLKTD